MRAATESPAGRRSGRPGDRHPALRGADRRGGGPDGRAPRGRPGRAASTRNRTRPGRVVVARASFRHDHADPQPRRTSGDVDAGGSWAGSTITSICSRSVRCCPVTTWTTRTPAPPRPHLLVGSGIAAMVDATPTGLGRRPEALARISRGTGLRDRRDHRRAPGGALRCRPLADAAVGRANWPHDSSPTCRTGCRDRRTGPARAGRRRRPATGPGGRAEGGHRLLVDQPLRATGARGGRRARTRRPARR